MPAPSQSGTGPAPAITGGGPGGQGTRDVSRSPAPEANVVSEVPSDPAALLRNAKHAGESRNRPAPLAPPVVEPVFSINFIRHETVPLRVRRALVYAGLGYLVLNVGLLIGLLATTYQTRQARRSLQGALQQVASADAVAALPQEMEEVRSRAREHLQQLNAMVSFQKQQFPVGGKLAALTATLPARTWIAELNGQRESRTVTVHAMYLVDPERPYELPTKEWIDALRADPRFREGLTRLELGSSSRGAQGRAELFSFDLIAQWQP